MINTMHFRFCFKIIHLKVLPVFLVFILFFNNSFSSGSLADGCSPLSTLACTALKVDLPYTLTFSNAVSGTLTDKNGLGTGFTTVNTYSGTRAAADGTVSNSLVPGYEPSKIAVTDGRLALIAGKGIDYLTSNNQINVLGVKIDAVKKFQLETKVINPYNGTQSQQAGLWYGLNDKTFIKLGVNGGKIELRKEKNDASSTVSGTSNPDQRITSAISSLNTKTVRLRMVIDLDAGIIEGFYSTDGTTYISTGATYGTPSLNITGSGLTGSEAYAGIFASYRNGTEAIMYNFDDFAVTSLSVTEPVFQTVNINFQTPATPTPSGYTADTGLPFDATRKYGWISPTTKLPVNLEANMRLRTGTAEVRQLSHVEMQNNTDGQVAGTWEYAVANGTYNVTVSAGEFKYFDSSHRLNVEGVTAINNFVATSSNKFKAATVTVQVTDGKLTVDATGGEHTKMNYVNISKVSDPGTTAAKLVLKNMDLFPADDQLVFSYIQTPWRRTSPTVTAYNANHDVVKLRINNEGTAPLTLSKLALSNSTSWKIVSVNSKTTVSYPITVSAGTYAEVAVQFMARGYTSRIKTFADTLSITSNDVTSPSKKVILRGLWQNRGEGNYEPYAQEIINAFGFKTKSGYTSNDGSVEGKNIMPNSNEIAVSYFVRADNTKPVTVHQMAAYHGCCTPTLVDTIKYYAKGSSVMKAIFAHNYLDSQSLIPRLQGSDTSPAQGSFEPAGAFRFEVGTSSSDRTQNFGGLIGLRFLKVIDSKGAVVPNAYLMDVDYLGATYTNYDYQDGIYYIENVMPQTANDVVASSRVASAEIIKSQISVYPNPGFGNDVNLSASSFGKNENLTISITQNMSERILHTETIMTDDAGNAKFPLKLKNNLNSGIYIIKVQSKSGITYSRLLIK